MNWITWIYIIILLIIFLFGARCAKPGQFVQNALPLRVTKGIQGFFALCILVHHLALQVRYLPAYDNGLRFFENLGVLFVGFFFFCSGYGLIISSETKEHYLDTFVKRRVFTVLVPFFICNYAFMFTTLLRGNQYSVGTLVQAFFGLFLLNDHMWFAVEIMILYMVFFLLFRFVKKEWVRYFLMTFFVLIMMTVSFFLGHEKAGLQGAYWFKGEWWYNTTPLMLVGMLIARFRKPLRVMAQKLYWVLLAVDAILFYGLFAGTVTLISTGGYWTEYANYKGYVDKITTLSVQLPMVISFVILLLLILLKVEINNKALEFFGKISLEMILLEKVFMTAFVRIGTKYSYNVYCALVIVATILVAIVINKVKMLVLEKK
ncbi:MAG TPA: acyltransferase [Lachnospiraceae bacterium]|nr:acyltransferase [Lachnospiraceae bacterium]